MSTDFFINGIVGGVYVALSTANIKRPSLKLDIRLSRDLDADLTLMYKRINLYLGPLYVGLWRYHQWK